MATIDRLIRPELAEARATHMSEGFVMGWVPGEITSLEDPEKLGRVKVRCDLLEQNSDLPNADEGWVWVMEEFTNNATTGGAHRLLKIGTQVALIPMLGDPKQMLLIGCIPNRVDRPHPDLDRAKEIYGSSTPNGVIVANNDAEMSQLIAYPHGVVQHVSPKGDIIQQTEEGARLNLQRDGNTWLENAKSFTHISNDGTLTQRSAGGAISILQADGQVKITTPFQASLDLTRGETKLIGPANKISRLLSAVRSTTSGFLGQGLQIAKNLEAVASDLGLGNLDLASGISEVEGYIDSLQSGILDKLPQGIETLTQLYETPPLEFGRTLLPQINTALNLNLDSIVSESERLLAKDLDGKTVASLLRNVVGEKLAKKIEIETLAAIIDNLNHDPKQQVAAILEHVLPEGFKQIQNLYGLDLHGATNKIKDIIYEQPPVFKSSGANDEFGIASVGLGIEREVEEFGISNEPLGLEGEEEEIYTTDRVISTLLGLDCGTEEDFGISDAQILLGTEQEQEFDISDTQIGLEGESEEFGISETQLEVEEEEFDVASTELGLESGAEEFKIENTELTFEEWIGGRSQLLNEILPGVNYEIINDLLVGVYRGEVEDPLVQMIGQAQRVRINSALCSLKFAGKSLFLVPLLRDVVQGVKSGDESLLQAAVKEMASRPGFEDLSGAKDPNSILQKAVGRVSENLHPQLEAAIGGVNPLINAIPSALAGGVVRVTQEMAEMYAGVTGIGSAVRVGLAGAEMIAPGGVNRIFAGFGGAGFKTKWGSFGFGSGGGDAFSLGKLLFRVGSEVGRSLAGISLDPSKGASILAYFADSDRDGDSDRSATVEAEGQNVWIRSYFSNGDLAHQILVNPDGVFVDEVDITDIFDLPNRFERLERRLQLLEANSSGGNATSV